MWFSAALETLYRLVVAFSSIIGNLKALANTYKMWSNIRPGAKRGIKRALGVLGVLMVLGVAIASSDLSFSFSNPLPGLINHPSLTTQPTQTPYSLLGVTTTSSTTGIAKAYCKLAHEASGPLGTSLFTGAQLAAYRSAYETITDPLQRCVYHQANNIPDWYGVPSPLMCWGEFTINRLEAAKSSVRASFGPNDLDGAFGRVYGTVEKCIKGRLAVVASYGPQVPTPRLATNMMDYIKSVIDKEFWVSLWTKVSGMSRERLSWLGKQARELVALLPSMPVLSREAITEWGSLFVLFLMVVFCLIGYFRPTRWMTVESESGFGSDSESDTRRESSVESEDPFEFEYVSTGSRSLAPEELEDPFSDKYEIRSKADEELEDRIRDVNFETRGKVHDELKALVRDNSETRSEWTGFHPAEDLIDLA